LDEICSGNAILVTNTSSFSVTDIASVTNTPEQIAGLHFFNPVPLMSLVEVVRGMKTSEKIVNVLYQLLHRCKKNRSRVKTRQDLSPTELPAPFITKR
jgi:3-hydroxybutyryl-CoA dehydrogenase